MISEKLSPKTVTRVYEEKAKKYNVSNSPKRVKIVEQNW